MITINSLSVFIAHVQHEIDHPLGDTCLLEGANSSLHKAQDINRLSEKSAGAGSSDTVQVTVDLIGVKRQQHVNHARTVGVY